MPWTRWGWLAAAALIVVLFLCFGTIRVEIRFGVPGKVEPARARAGRTIAVVAPQGGVVQFLGTGSAGGAEGQPLRPGDGVEVGQVLGRLDDRLARHEAALAEWEHEAARAKLKEAADRAQEAERRARAEELAREKVPGVRGDDLQAARLTARRYREEEEARKQAVRVTEHQAAWARLVLEQQEIRSPVAGVVEAVVVRPGQVARRFGTVLLLRVEEE